MVRLTAVLACLCAMPALASAQGIVYAGYAPVVTYAPPPVVTAYYAPAPVVTSFYAAPTVSYYAAPAVSYYTTPAVSYYTTPAVSYYTTPAVVTYRHPLLRPYATVVRTYPGTTVAVPAAPVVASYYPPAVYIR